MTKGSLVKLSFYVPIYIAARVAFTTYRYAEGYDWLNGFLFISHDYFTLVCFAVIALVMLRISIILWSISRSITKNSQPLLSAIISGMVVSIALYGLNSISIMASLQILRLKNFDLVLGYVQ
jgi:hypothetical protein